MAIKCLIPAAGKGTRVRPLSHTLPKAMLQVAGKSTIFHIIDSVRAIGITDFVIVTGYLKELMEAEILTAYPELNITFVEQNDPQGLGHACYLASTEIAAHDSLLIVYGDTLFEADLAQVITSELPLIGVYPVEDPRRFGIVELEEQGYIKKFVEKPDQPTSNLAMPGIIYFPEAGMLQAALNYIIKNGIRTKGEYQVTDAYDYLVRHNQVKMKTFKLSAWYDAGTLEALLETNRDLLKLQASVIHGQIENCEIIDPVYIAAGATVKNSKIGPFASLASQVVAENCEIANSIIDQKCELKNVGLNHSILGRFVKMQNARGEFILGDDSSVNG